MPAANEIYYLENNKINRALWDECISNSPNGLIYGYSQYLDHMAYNWDGLVLNNYEAVMPLPWKKKYGIYYLYQPFLTAQSGLFGPNINGKLLQDFFDAVPGKFRLWEFSLNHGNMKKTENYHLQERTNFILDLSPAYEHLFGNYRDNVKRNIRKSVTYGCYIKTAIPVDWVSKLVKDRDQNISARDLMHFQNLYQELHSKGKAQTYGVFSKQNELIASAVFLYSHSRSYYILIGNHPDGRTLGASHALVDAFIKDHSERKLWLDFEGSDLRNLAFFYSGFGAVEEKYPAIRINRLPWYARIFKG